VKSYAFVLAQGKEEVAVAFLSVAHAAMQWSVHLVGAEVLGSGGSGGSDLWRLSLSVASTSWNSVIVSVLKI
jgi:hypothetical protein